MFAAISLGDVVLLATAVASFREYSRRRKLLSSRKKFNIYDDVRASLDQLKQAKPAFSDRIKIYEEDEDPDSLLEMPFSNFCKSARLAGIFEENADLLEQDEARMIAEFLDLGIGFESMVIDSKSEAFLRISKKRQINFYVQMSTEIDNLIKSGEKITGKFEPMFKT